MEPWQKFLLFSPASAVLQRAKKPIIPPFYVPFLQLKYGILYEGVIYHEAFRYPWYLWKTKGMSLTGVKHKLELIRDALHDLESGVALVTWDCFRNAPFCGPGFAELSWEHKDLIFARRQALCVYQEALKMLPWSFLEYPEDAQLSLFIESEHGLPPDVYGSGPYSFNELGAKSQILAKTSGNTLFRLWDTNPLHNLETAQAFLQWYMATLSVAPTIESALIQLPEWMCAMGFMHSIPVLWEESNGTWNWQWPKGGIVKCWDQMLELNFDTLEDFQKDPVWASSQVLGLSWDGPDYYMYGALKGSRVFRMGYWVCIDFKTLAEVRATTGCHVAAPFLQGICRALNIPICIGLVEHTHWGMGHNCIKALPPLVGEEVHHTVFCPVTGKAMWHADDSFCRVPFLGKPETRWLSLGSLLTMTGENALAAPNDLGLLKHTYLQWYSLVWMVNDEECKKAVIEWMRFGLRDFLFGSSFTGALCTHDGMTLNDLDDMVANGEFLAFPLLAKGGGPAFPGELKWVYCKSLKMLWYEWNEAGLFPKTNEHPKREGLSLCRRAFCRRGRALETAPIGRAVLGALTVAFLADGCAPGAKPQTDVEVGGAELVDWSAGDEHHRRESIEELVRADLPDACDGNLDAEREGRAPMLEIHAEAGLDVPLEAGADEDHPCVPDCSFSECGVDGCGGSCGACTLPAVCVGWKCCTPDCTGKECGDDGCLGSCGQCPASNETCDEGQCVCQPECDGTTYGLDGCGGTCFPDNCLPIETDIIWYGWDQDTKGILQMIPPDSVGPLVQVNGNALVVQWLAVVTADCKQPDAFCVTMENNELGFFLTDLGCIPPVFPCYCSDYDAIANVTASPMVLGPGTYSVTVGCDFSLAPYYCGEPEVFAVIVEE